MYRIIRGNCTGKTKELLEEAQKTGGIVASARPEALKEKAMFYGYGDVTIVHYDQVIGYCYQEPVYIDELENFVACCCNHSFKGYTLTNE